MTKEEFRYIIDLKKEFEFSYNGKNYNLTYGKTEGGQDFIAFGERFFQQKFSSWGELMNTAKVENHFLREMLDILDSPL